VPCLIDYLFACMVGELVSGTSASTSAFVGGSYRQFSCATVSKAKVININTIIYDLVQCLLLMFRNYVGTFYQRKKREDARRHKTPLKT
jgi:hypothetical protein